VVEHLVEYSRVLAGDRRRFDEDGRRLLVQRDVERARDVAALQNHNAIPDSGHADGELSTVTAPTLVIHGTADPLLPPRYGEALTAEIPGARLLVLDGAGHGVDPIDWETIVAAVVDHSGAPRRSDR
jgi:pimeloyl-ACP methyl ester carboxylesterase